MEGRLLPAAAVLLQLCGKDQHSGYTPGRGEKLTGEETGEALKRTLKKKGGTLWGSWGMRVPAISSFFDFSGYLQLKKSSAVF